VFEPGASGGTASAAPSARAAGGFFCAGAKSFLLRRPAAGRA